MAEQLEIQTTAINPAIRLQFERGEDRWGHRLFFSTDRSELELMASVEGTPDQIWPSSPPFQDVSQHSLDQGDAILCVGMAGKSHWSASFSVEREGQNGAIKADLACLQKELSSAANLGSTYALDPNWEVRTFTDHRLEIVMSNQKVVEIEALRGEDFETVFELIDRTLMTKPSQVSTSPIIATRWGFVVNHR